MTAAKAASGTQAQGRAMTKKKSKAVMLDSVPIKPISATEHRRIDRQIKKKYERLRKQYYEIHGKKVDWISHWIEEGTLFFTVRFTDGKCFSITYSPCVLLDTVDFSDMSTGDNVVLKEYYAREDL